MRSEEQHASAGHGAEQAPTAGSTMRAIVQHGYGSAGVLRPRQVSVPTVAADQVLVRVRAAGLDRGTWHVMKGKPYLLRLAFGLRAPKVPVPGMDVAGVVVAIGAGVTRFAPGDEVFGIGQGTFAEYTVAAQNTLARKPEHASFEQAAVAGVSALTALQALTDAGQVESGQKVLIIGASGGVGSFAVQLAVAFGAEVTGVCSPAKADLVRSLGARHVIDYTRDDFASGAAHYDLIIDLGGNPSASRLRRALTPAGTAVIAGGEEGGPVSGGMGRQLRALAMSLVVRQQLRMLLCKQRGSDLERIARLIDDGKVTPSIGASYPLDQVPEAMRLLDSGQVRGKIAITI